MKLTNNHLRILIIAAVGLLAAFIPFPTDRSHPAEHTINITARSFEFYPAEISVQPGDRVTIALTADDVVHGLYLDSYDLQITADPGQTQTLTFIADQPGTFRFRCSVTCGDLHPFMIGKLHVGTSSLFWRALGLALVSAIVILTPIKRSTGTSTSLSQS